MITTKTVQVSVIEASDDHGRKAGDLRKEQRCNMTTLFTIIRSWIEIYPFVELLLELIDGYKITDVDVEQSKSTYDLGLKVRVSLECSVEHHYLSLSASEEKLALRLVAWEPKYHTILDQEYPLNVDRANGTPYKLRRMAADNVIDILSTWAVRS